MLELEMERASLRAWPAAVEFDLEGWVVRAAGGYTKRANSVTVLSRSIGSLEDRIAECEHFYASRGLPAIFRLLSFASPGDLDRTLRARRYTHLHPTSVLCLDLKEWASGNGAAGPEIQYPSLNAWMDIYARFNDQPPDQRALHRAMLARIGTMGNRSIHRLQACACHLRRPVSCALGVLDGRLFGLFDVITAPSERNKGHATALIGAMLDWAVKRGAAHAYLQVMDQNEPARRLYARMGFLPVYRYWYRVQPEGDA